MSTARDEILGRVRSALADGPRGERSPAIPVERGYRRVGERTSEQRLELFSERLIDYHASVRRVAADEVGTAVAEACAERRLRRIVIPAALPDAWRPVPLAGPPAGAGNPPGGVELIEDHGLPALELDAIDGAITGCAVAIAETGTLVLDGEGPCGRRLITLVPDHHICIVRADQVLELVPEAIAVLAPSVAERRLPLTLISGPSASSDIELQRVEGVHGPRNLLVLIVE